MTENKLNALIVKYQERCDIELELLKITKSPENLNVYSRLVIYAAFLMDLMDLPNPTDKL